MTDVFQGLAGIAMLLWIVAAIGAGARLLRIGMRRNNRPAKLLGTYLLIAMGLGTVTMSIPMAHGAAPGASITWLDRALLAAGCSLTTIGICAILTFTREVFRRDSGWAKGVAIAIAAIVVMGLVGHGLTTGFDWQLGTGFGVLYLAGTLLANGWTSLESLLYYRLMRKRTKLGLADPLATHRFLLWGLGAGSSVSLLLLCLVQEWMRVTLGPEALLAFRSVALLAMAFFGLSCAVCYLFAFAPAGWYARWLDPGRAATSAPSVER